MWLISEQFLNNENSDLPQYSSDFWIYNYEIFYDLNRRCYSFDSKENTSIDNMDSMDITEQSCQNNGGLRISELPTEIISKIFGYLRAIDLLVVREVCSKWRDIVAADKALWNHIHFSSADLDVKTTVSLLSEMPLLRSVELCNVHSVDDMSRLTAAICHACWDLRQVHFPENCEWHPSSLDLHQLCYFHPYIKSLHLCTKQKLSAIEIANIGSVLQGFECLTDLKLFGFYWQQVEVITSLLGKLEHLTQLSLPSLPGWSAVEIQQIISFSPELKSITINTSSLNAANKRNFKLTELNRAIIIDSSTITPDKLTIFGSVRLISLDINLSNSRKEEVCGFFKKLRPTLLYLKVSNCGYSDELLNCLAEGCVNLISVVWENPKDVIGEVTDAGILAVTRLPLLHRLEIKSRSVSKAHYSAMAAMKNLKYARINGMRVPGCL